MRPRRRHSRRRAARPRSRRPPKPKAAEKAPAKAAEKASPKASEKSGATPAQKPGGTPAKVDSAAPQTNADRAEKVSDRVSGGVPDAEELPVDDFDHMTLGQLRGRLRKLTVEDLVKLRSYEKAHADRLPIMTMLDNRIAKVTAEAEATKALPKG